MKEIEELIEISRKYGKDSRYVIAGHHYRGRLCGARP